MAVVISLDLQMFPRILNALRAFPILASTSSSVPPVMFMTLPKYVKDVTSSPYADPILNPQVRFRFLG